MTYPEWLAFHNVDYKDQQEEDKDKWMAGLSHTDPLSAFHATIEIRSGHPLVRPSPDLGKWRTYTLIGSPDLKTWDPLHPIPDPIPDNLRFFKVKVGMP